MFNRDLLRILIDEELCLLRVSNNYRMSIDVLKAQPDAEDFTDAVDELLDAILINLRRLFDINAELIRMRDSLKLQRSARSIQ